LIIFDKWFFVVVEQKVEGGKDKAWKNKKMKGREGYTLMELTKLLTK